MWLYKDIASDGAYWLTLLLYTRCLFSVHEGQILPRGIAMKLAASTRINYPDGHFGSRWKLGAHESMRENAAAGG